MDIVVIELSFNSKNTGSIPKLGPKLSFLFKLASFSFKFSVFSNLNPNLQQINVQNLPSKYVVSGAGIRTHNFSKTILLP